MRLQTIILILFSLFQPTADAQTNLQTALNTFKNSQARSTTLVLVNRGDTTTEFASINSDSAYHYDLNSSFYIGSISKTFTAIVILKLCEEGKLNLSDPISQFSFSKKINKNIPRKITVKNLLQHTSGIADFNLKILDSKNAEQNLNTLPLINPYLNYSEDNVLSRLMNKMDFVPNKKCIYSNSNYYLLAKIIEEVADMPYAEAIRKYIITPLGLQNTFPYLSKSVKNIVHSYDDYENDITNLNMLSLNKVYQGSGNITSSVNDLNILFTELFIKKTVLKDSTLKRMLTFKPDKENGFDTGLGILKTMQLGEKYIGHQGDIISNETGVFYNENTNLIFSFLTTESDPVIRNKILKAIILNCNKK